MPQFSGGFDPCADCVFNIGQCFFRSLAIAHAAWKVRDSCNKTSAVFFGKWLDDDCVSTNVQLFAPEFLLT